MIKHLISVLAALALASATASAQTATPGLNARQRNEQARIRRGVRSGELTRAEAACLNAREADIRADKRAACADGVVTRDERQASVRTSGGPAAPSTARSTTLNSAASSPPPPKPTPVNQKHSHS